jgi:hypothetical protein
LLFELTLEQICALAYDKRVGLLDIIVQHCLTLDIRIKFSFKNHFATSSAGLSAAGSRMLGAFGIEIASLAS